MSRVRRCWSLPIAVVAVFLCVLSFYRTTAAQTDNPATPPFANSVQLRLDIVAQLQETNRLLKEQNELLRSGQLKVIVSKDNP